MNLKNVGLVLLILGWGCASWSAADRLAPSSACIPCTQWFEIARLTHQVEQAEAHLFQDRRDLVALGPDRLQAVSDCQWGYEHVREQVMRWTAKDLTAYVDLGAAEKTLRTLHTKAATASDLKQAQDAVDLALTSVRRSQSAADDVGAAHRGYLACAGEAGGPVPRADAPRSPTSPVWGFESK